MSIIPHGSVDCKNFRSQTTNGSRHPSNLVNHEFLKKLPWLILCSIDGLNKTHGSCRANINYWAYKYNVSKRTIERALSFLNHHSYLVTKGVGKVSKRAILRGAIRSVTQKAYQLFVSRKMRRPGARTAFMKSLADHTARILNNIYIQDKNNNYLPTTNLPTVDKPPHPPPERDFFNVLEKKLREKPREMAARLWAKVKNMYQENEKRFSKINHPCAYANSLIRQEENLYNLPKLQSDSANRHIAESKCINNYADYQKPNQSLVDNSLAKMKEFLKLDTPRTKYVKS